MMNKKIIEKIYAKKSIEKINKKVLLLGSNTKIDAISFMNYRLILSVLIFILVLCLSSYGFIYGPLLTLGFYIGSEFLILDYNIKKRSKKLDNDSLFFFEILTLSLESGRNLKGALDMTVKSLDNELSSEFKFALNEMAYGKTLTEVLNSLRERIPSEVVNNVILNITESSIFGSSIIDTLYNQVDYIRDKRFLEVKAVINKMPMKMSVISVVSFIPIILLLLLGPILVEFLS